MQSSTILSLNVQTPNYAIVMHAVQFDKLSRKITAYLFDGALPFIPPEGALAMVRYSKPDGTMGFYDTLEDDETAAVTWEGNTATVWLAEQVLTVAGNVICQIQFFTSTERLSTFTFVIGVEANAVSDESIESTDYFSILTQRIEAILGAVVYPPTINAQNHWVLFDPETQEYYDSGVDATGPTGQTGPTGPYMASIAKISGTGAAGTTDQYQVTLSDGTHPTGTISVYNGADGQGAPGSATPLMDGTASAGSANAYAREDHRHPSDTSKVDVTDFESYKETAKNRNFILIGDSFGRGISPNVAEADWKGWQYWFEDSFGDMYTIHSCVTGGAGISGFASSLPFETMLAASESAYASFANDVTDIVVLGGTNDEVSNEANIRTAIASFCSYCAMHYPNATVRIGCLGSNFKKMYDMGGIYQYCTECGAVYMPDGRALYSDTAYISSDDVHLTQAGYAYYKDYTNNLIASGHCHYVFRKITPISVVCGTPSETYYIINVLTEKTISFNIIPNSGSSIGISSTSVPAYGNFNFGSFTQQFKNIPIVQENYLISGLNLHFGAGMSYGIYGTVILLLNTQSGEIIGTVNSMGTASGGDIRGACTPTFVPY